MKRFFMLLFIVISFSARAQWGCYNTITFDNYDTLYRTAIIIDTVNYPNNKWQIGAPHELSFTYPYSPPNVIVTDTVNPFPPNDTSVFMLKIPRKIYPYPSLSLYSVKFRYQTAIDTGNYAKVEISIDSGLHWGDITDTLPTDCHWQSPIPNFSISTSSWQVVRLNLLGLSWAMAYDTVLFKFTYLSDTTTAYKDGWMIDEIEINYWCEGASSNIQNDKLVSICPNPSKGNIHIQSNALQKQNVTVSIYNLLGQEVYRTKNVPPDGNLHLQLPDGIYTLKYFAGDEYSVKRIVFIN